MVNRAVEMHGQHGLDGLHAPRLKIASDTNNVSLMKLDVEKVRDRILLVRNEQSAVVGRLFFILQRVVPHHVAVCTIVDLCLFQEGYRRLACLDEAGVELTVAVPIGLRTLFSAPARLGQPWKW